MRTHVVVIRLQKVSDPTVQLTVWLHRGSKWAIAFQGELPLLAIAEWTPELQSVDLQFEGGDVARLLLPWSGAATVVSSEAASDWCIAIDASSTASASIGVAEYKGEVSWEQPVVDEDAEEGAVEDVTRPLEIAVVTAGHTSRVYVIEFGEDGLPTSVNEGELKVLRSVSWFSPSNSAQLVLNYTDGDGRRLKGSFDTSSGKRHMYVLRKEPINLYGGRCSALESCDLDGVIKLLKSGEVKNVVFMLGAGISVAAGIPDYRTPGTGLYSTLQKYNLPTPESVFTLEYLRKNPSVFFDVERELPDTKQLSPTDAHRFLKMVSDKKMLRRVYTQNVDGFERRAGVPVSELVECHGHGFSAHCIECKAEMPIDAYERIVYAEKGISHCTACNGTVVADFVLYGMSLPDRFFELREADTEACDLLIIMGTSLKVMPFAMLVAQVPTSCPRVLINNERCGADLGMFFHNTDATASRNVHLSGDLQAHCRAIMEALSEGE